jgi:hypothetical protein
LEWIEINPIKKGFRKKIDNKIERWLTLEEEKRIINASPKWLQEIIIFAINTGFRQSEILDLKWSQINLKRRTVTISEQKNKGVDTLPLSEATLEVLKVKDAISHVDADLVFHTGNNTRFLNRNVFRMFKSAMEKAKIKNLRFHDLRHTFATRLVQNGADIYTVQKLGRWRSIKMVERYGHHNVESLRSGINVMDRVNKSEFITITKSKGSQTVITTCNPLYLMVGQGRIELPTLGFSVRISELSNLLILIYVIVSICIIIFLLYLFLSVYIKYWKKSTHEFTHKILF